MIFAQLAPDPEQAALRAVAALSHMREAVARAGRALDAGDADEVLAALDARERLQPDVEAAIAALLGARSGAAGAQRERVDRLLEQVRSEAEALRADSGRLDIALVAGRDEVRDQLARLDEVGARSQRYRGAEDTSGGSIDFTG